MYNNKETVVTEIVTTISFIIPLVRFQCEKPPRQRLRPSP